MLGEVMKTARQNSRPFLGYLRKTTGGHFGPPPIGARVNFEVEFDCQQFWKLISSLVGTELGTALPFQAAPGI